MTPRHTLQSGRQLIEGIARLGSVLGYAVREELPVQKRRRNPPAVDVAWLGDGEHEFPLMIFEVESRASNSAAANAVKVFSQSNEQFEKPLFFFHIFMAGGEDTSRIDDLRRLFGSHNYRVYRFDEDDRTRFVTDILIQHRRLKKDLKLETLMSALDHEAWRGLDLDRVLRQAEDLRFNANFLPSYASLSKKRPGMLSHFLRVLGDPEDSPGHPRGIWQYSTYIGYNWPTPIHIGLLALHFPLTRDHLGRLRSWQEKTSYMSMIGPHLGLSRDFDDFLLGWAPAYLAFIAALMYKIDGAQAYTWDMCRLILDKLQKAPIEVSFPTAIWMAHVAAAGQDEARFEVCRRFINERGGASIDALCEPPSIVGFQELDEEWVALVNDSRKPMPSLQNFRRDLRPHYSSVDDVDAALTALAIDVLTNDEAVYEWSGPVALLLHAPSGLTRARTCSQQAETPRLPHTHREA